MIMKPYTTEEALVQHAQEVIMSRGFISAIDLAMELMKHLYKRGDENEDIDIPKLIENSIADDKDFHKIEYTNNIVSYRIKTLFYYRPKGTGRKRKSNG